jgi:protein-tyrosine-phosphatase
VLTPDEPFRILFVCSGNTCRSPLAEAAARRVFEEDGLDGIVVSSAGAFAVDGGRASAGSQEVARSNGLDLEAFQSRKLTAAEVHGADLILVMEAAHRSAVLGISPQADTKTFLLGELAGREGSDASVPDPFGGGAEMYRKTFRRIGELLDDALERIVELARSKRAGSP